VLPHRVQSHSAVVAATVMEYEFRVPSSEF